MEFVITNPRISKPRVRGSNPLGRAKKTLVLNPHFRCCTKDSKNIYFYLFIVMSLSCLEVYIKSNPNLLAITTYGQVDTKSILLRHLICCDERHEVHILFHMTEVTQQWHSAIASLPVFQRRLIRVLTFNLFQEVDPLKLKRGPTALD